jgi:hypothetical protein
MLVPAAMAVAPRRKVRRFMVEEALLSSMEIAYGIRRWESDLRAKTRGSSDNRGCSAGVPPAYFEQRMQGMPALHEEEFVVGYRSGRMSAVNPRRNA